jgi:hypothetical protein
MATRSPTAAHAYWGVFATTADLPNVAASPTQKGTLEAGDQAYVTGSGLYVCTTATLGAAVWVLVGGGAGPFVDISLDAVVTGAGPEVVGAVYLFSGSVILAASRSLLGTLAGGTATLRVRRQSTGVLVAGFQWSVTGVITNAVLVGNVNIVADDWYTLELERDAGPTVAVCYGVQLVR